MLDDYNTVQFNNSLTPKHEFKWTSLEKGNNLDELSNIQTKAEERSVIQILFRTQDPKKRQAQSGIRQKLQLIHDPLCFRNPPIRSIYRKNPQSVRF